MESHRTSKIRHPFTLALQAAGGTLAACLLLAAAPAMAETVVTGQSDTILRIGRTAEKKFDFPAYEYLRIGIATSDSNGGTLSANFGGWGRVSLDDGSGREYRKTYENDLQYGYISYQAAKNNLIATAGRQFVTEGVATERLDGIYFRSDLYAGLAVSAFAGNSVVTEPNLPGGAVVFGGRVSHTLPQYFTIGFSALRSPGDIAPEREELGADIWLHPVKSVDITGRSTFNSIKHDWMEHAYAVSVAPIDKFRISADVSHIKYRHYFSDIQTSSVFKLVAGVINPNEELTSIGAILSFAPEKNLSLSADYKRFEYEIADSADYFGAKLAYAKPESYAAGASIHRMDGRQDKLRYTEFRVYATKEFHNADLTLDLIDIHYDKSVNSRSNAFTATAAVGYRVDKNLKFAADIDYSTNPDTDNEVRALVKMTYAFDMKSLGEGRVK